MGATNGFSSREGGRAEEGRKLHGSKERREEKDVAVFGDLSITW